MNSLADVNPKQVASYITCYQLWRKSKPGNYRKRLHETMNAITNDIVSLAQANGAQPDTVRSIIHELETTAYHSAS